MEKLHPSWKRRVFVKKILLTNQSDYWKMIDDEWLEGTKDKPDKYPCVAIIHYTTGNSYAYFVYLSDFKMA